MATGKTPACFALYRLQRFLFLLLFFFLFPPQPHAADRTVRVAVYEAKPSIFMDQSGKPAGIYIDILEDIAKSEGWQLVYVPLTWTEGLEQLQRGEVDLIGDIALTGEREQWFSFSKVPVVSSWSMAYARRGSGIVSILDLKGKRVTVLANSVQESSFLRFSKGFDLGLTLIPLKDYPAVFSMVARKEADVAISFSVAGEVYKKRYGLDRTAIMFDPIDGYYATSKNDPKKLLTTIDRHIAAMKGDPTSVYFTALKQWLPQEEPGGIPVWIWIGGALVLGCLLLSLAGSAILRQQVKVRTRELQKINEEMEQRIIQRTAELAAAMERAQAADRIKSAFLATMSHELRTPLNSIIGFTGILLQGLAGPLNDEQHKQLSMVQNSSRHLLALINDVLDLSKIEAGQLVLARATFDLRQAVTKMIPLIAPLAEKKGITLRQDLPATPVMLTTDQRRVEQVVLNLLSNAVKFTETGEVTAGCGVEGGQGVLSVRDTGIGMRPEELPHLFQPFHQIDTGLTRRHEGTGLGLSICKKLLDLMGGSIEVASHWGQGSVFTARFPLSTEGVDEQADSDH